MVQDRHASVMEMVSLNATLVTAQAGKTAYVRKFSRHARAMKYVYLYIPYLLHWFDFCVLLTTAARVGVTTAHGYSWCLPCFAK